MSQQTVALNRHSFDINLFHQRYDLSVVVPVVETGTWNAEAEFILKDTDANDFLFIKVCIMNRKLLPVIEIHQVIFCGRGVKASFGRSIDHLSAQA